jgi:L-alanine-DL-glutamate epimerase-like enolase superfamily enzyme
MRERFIPRVLEADPKSLVADEGGNLDPHKVWSCMYTNERPGGHGERAVAMGTIDMAVWDCVGDGRESVLDAGRAQPHSLRRHASRPGLAAIRLRVELRTGTLAMLHQHGWSASRCIPHGGHPMSLNIAAGLGLGGNESYPDLFQPFGGFPDGVKVEDSHIIMPDLPGIGFEGKSDLYKEMKALAA